ncbi:MAG: hypothetical protein ABIH46_13990 [Chloroflexota bacterium]
MNIRLRVDGNWVSVPLDEEGHGTFRDAVIKTYYGRQEVRLETGGPILFVKKVNDALLLPDPLTTCPNCDRLRWAEHVNQLLRCEERTIMEDKGICFDCAFWMRKKAWAADPRWVRINGSSYYIEDDTEYGFKGFGGVEFIIEKKSGERVVAHNLWTQGPMPQWFRDQFPDNAKFVQGG